VYTGLSWTPSPREPAEAKPNISQQYLSRLSLAKPAKLNFLKLLPLELKCGQESGDRCVSGHKIEACGDTVYSVYATV
jgi:hypothetical protein